MKIRLFLLLLLFCLSHLLYAQTFTEVQDNIFEDVKFSSVAFSDVNGDSYQDVLITGKNGSGALISKLYINEGDGNYYEAPDTPFEGVQGSSIAFADVNGDTYPDVLITGENNVDTNISKLYINEGDGNFIEKQNVSFQGVSYGSVAFADINGDTYLDLLITGYTNQLEDVVANLYINDGAGNYTEDRYTSIKGVGHSSIAFADVNGDMAQDVIITGLDYSQSRISTLYINDGTGDFSEQMGTPFKGVIAGSIVFTDVNGDMAQDVFITGWHNSGLISSLYINDGTGDFTKMSPTPFDGLIYSSIAVGDVNNDNHQDIFISGGGDSSLISKLYINDGSGNFSEHIDTPFKGLYFGSVAIADINNDNYPDILLTGRDFPGTPHSKLYFNDGMTSSVTSDNSDIKSPFEVYPNPSKNGRVSVEYISSSSTNLKISLFDINNKLISLQNKNVTSGKNVFQLSVNNLPKGIYLLLIEDKMLASYKKLIIQ